MPLRRAGTPVQVPSSPGPRISSAPRREGGVLRSIRGTGALFHRLLDDAAEREQALVDGGRHLADEFDDTPPVFEDAGLPYQLVAELVYFRLVGRCGVLQRLQRQGVVADLFGGFA